MWRLLRPTGVAPLLRQIPKGLASGEQVTMQRVKYPPRIPWKRYVAYTFAGLAAFYVYNVIVVSPLLRALAEAVKDLPEPEDDEVEPLFIPFPLTMKRIPQQPYSGQSPEWLEFVKMSKDKELVKRVRLELVAIVKDTAEGAPLLLKRMGGQVKLSRSWLDIDYPYSPPPEYERSGILITDDAIAWASMPVDSKTVFHTKRILWPETLTLSSTAFLEALFRQNLNDVAKYLGIDTKGSSASKHGVPPTLPNAQSPDMQKVLEKMRQQSTQRPEEVKDPSSLAAQNAKREQPDAKAQGPPVSEKKPSPESTSELVKSITVPPSRTSDGRRDSTEPQPEKFPGHGRIRDIIGTKPKLEFEKKFMQGWRRALELPPRGSVFISGLVELEGPKGYVVLDVMAFYDPVEKKYHKESIRLKVRRMQMKVQQPAR